MQPFKQFAKMQPFKQFAKIYVKFAAKSHQPLLKLNRARNRTHVLPFLCPGTKLELRENHERTRQETEPTCSQQQTKPRKERAGTATKNNGSS